MIVVQSYLFVTSFSAPRSIVDGTTEQPSSSGTTVKAPSAVFTMRPSPAAAASIFTSSAVHAPSWV